MTCVRCGKQIVDGSSYCNVCGARQGSFRSKRLTRSSSESQIAGVCGGIAEYFGVDATIVRLIWVALSVFPGGIIGGILAYLAAWLIMPVGASAKKAVEVPFEPHAKAS